MSKNKCNVNIHTHICIYYVDDSEKDDDDTMKKLHRS